jgi:hypothetical protein
MGCDIPIADDSVSRLHAELAVEPDGNILVIDNHSRNGTAVIRGGQLVRVADSAAVSPDDEVQFGDVVLRVRDLLHGKLPETGAARPPSEAIAPYVDSAWTIIRRRWRESIIAAMVLAAVILLAFDSQSQTSKFLVGIMGSVIASLVLSMVQGFWQKK